MRVPEARSNQAEGSGEGMVDRRELLVRGAGVLGAAGLMPLVASGNALARTATAASSGGKTIGFSYLYSELSFVPDLVKFANQRAKALGYTMLVDNVTNGNVVAQLANLQSLISRKVDALVVHVADPKSYGSIVNQSKAAGIPFFTYATAVKGTDGGVLFPFYPQAEQLATDATHWVKQHLSGDGEILILSYTGDPLGIQASKELGQGIARHTHAKVVASQDALDQVTALSVTEDALKAHPDINIVMAWNDAGALGAAQAMKKAGKDPSKVYIGSDEGTQEGIKAMLGGNKYLKTLDVLSIQALGFAVADLPHQYFAKGKKGNINVPGELVHSDQKALLRKALKQQ